MVMYDLLFYKNYDEPPLQMQIFHALISQQQHGEGQK